MLHTKDSKIVCFSSDDFRLLLEKWRREKRKLPFDFGALRFDELTLLVRHHTIVTGISSLRAGAVVLLVGGAKRIV